MQTTRAEICRNPCTERPASLGTVHGSDDFYTGRASAGGKASWNFQMTGNISLAPYAGLYADWRFSGNGDEDTSGSADSLIGDGWSASTATGATLQSVNGASFKLGGEVAGIGASTQIWPASGRFSLSF